MKNYNLIWLEKKQTSNKKIISILKICFITILYLLFFFKSMYINLIIYIPLIYGILYLNDSYITFLCETTEVILALPFTIDDIISNKSIFLYKKVLISTIISFFTIILFKIVLTRNFIHISSIDIVSVLVITVFLLILIPFYGVFFFTYGIRKKNLINFIFIILIFFTSIFISLKLYYMVFILYLISSIIMFLRRKSFLYKLSKEKIIKEV